MTDPQDDDPDEVRLAGLLSDAVSDVEPRDALDSIRNRTKVTPMSARRRPWSYAVGGAVVATAALVAAVALAGDQLGLTGPHDTSAATEPQHQPGRAHRGSASPDEGTASGEPSASASPTTATTLAVYYLGDTPQGTRLYREFDHAPDGDPVAGALSLLVSTPNDPDYSTPWEPGDFAGGSMNDGAVDITVDGSLAQRPAGMSEQDAKEAIQQVVYTVQAAVQSRVPVRFSLGTVLGVDTTEPVSNASPIDVLALVSISDPEQGATVGDTFTASGVASSFEANVPWEIRQGDTVVKEGYATAEGWMDKLYPWQADIDVSDLSPGDYTFVAMTDDPSSGEGGGPHVDTRALTIQ